MLASRLRLSPLLLALVLLPACSTPKPEADSAAPPDSGDAPPAEPAVQEPEAEPEPEAPAQEEPTGPVETRELVLVPSELSASEDGKTYEHCLDCRRKSATYTYCVFDKAAFDAAVGTPAAGAELKLTVEMSPLGSDTHVPDDPNASQPDGGFRHDRFRCTVTATAPAG